MKRKEFKRCPRCDKKTPIYQDRCEGCGLIFSRLARASNTAAKKALKKKDLRSPTSRSADGKFNDG